MEWFSNITASPVFLRIAGIFLGVSSLFLWLSLIIWVVKDARSRSRDILAALISGLLVLILTIPGFLIYLLLRPGETITQRYEKALEEEVLLNEIRQKRQCIECGNTLLPEWLVCPQCGQSLRSRCNNCDSVIESEWAYCPFCGLRHERPSNGHLPQN